MHNQKIGGEMRNEHRKIEPYQQDARCEDQRIFLLLHQRNIVLRIIKPESEMGKK